MRVHPSTPRPLDSTPTAKASKSAPAAATAPAGTQDRLDRTSSARAPVALVSPAVAENPDSDPMVHINHLSTLEGRGSPSKGYDTASAYAAALLEKYGAVGPNASDPSGNPFFQTFTLRTFADAPEVDREGPPPVARHGKELFSGGFYLDDTLSAADRARIQKRIGGQSVRAPAPLTPEALDAAGVASGTVQNVVGVFPGSGPNKGQTLLLTAHLDHEGIKRGVVYPGADDNGSGSGTLLSALPALAELSRTGQLDCSVAVIFTAAEEKGLVGAKYFVDHPLPGLGVADTFGPINTDMVGRFEADRMSVIHRSGGKPNYWKDVLEKANQGLGDKAFQVINRDIDSLDGRHDGGMWSRKGEDVLMLYEGLSRRSGGGDMNPDYHQPTDTPDKILRDNGGEKPRRFRDILIELVKTAAGPRPEGTPLVWE